MKNFYDFKIDNIKGLSEQEKGFRNKELDLFSKNGFPNKKEILNKNYSREIQYNNQSSRFELKQYENILKKDLIREISINILNDISNTND